MAVNLPRARGKKLALGRTVLKSDGTTLRVRWAREEILKALRDDEASGR